MSDRYFASPHKSDGRLILDGPEAHHAIHVKRVKPGDRIVVFDGSGVEFSVRVQAVQRTQVELDVLKRTEIDRELPITLTLGAALPKGDRQRWLVEKAVELGVSRIVPLITSRSVAQPTANARGRLRRTVIEASKQCGRNRLTEIAEPRAWADFLVETSDAVRGFAHPAASTDASTHLDRIVPGQNVCLAVGPEGGFTDEETAQATAAAWDQIDLGPRILRIETAAVFCVALVVQQLWRN